MASSFIMATQGHGDDVLRPAKLPGMFSFSTIIREDLPPVTTAPTAPILSDKIFSPTKEILPLYFCYLERFQFGEAARVLSLAASTMNEVWALFPPLQLLAACECIYHSLIFLEVMSNNQYLEVMYSEVEGGILAVLDKWTKKGQDAKNKSRPTQTTNVSTEGMSGDSATQYFLNLLRELVIYVNCRQKLVELRHKLHKGVFEATPAVLREGLASLDLLLPSVSKISHQMLVQVSQNIHTEIEMFRKLLQAELAIANYKANESLFYFNLIDVELQSWKSKYLFVKDKTESGAFLDTSIHKWCVSFRDHLFGKMKLFFHDLFKEQRTLIANHAEDPFLHETAAELLLHEKIVEFTVTTGCFNVSLVLQPASKKATGKSSWNAIYTFPQPSAPLDHWPNMISLYQDNASFIDTVPVIKQDPSMPLMDRNRAQDIPLNILQYYDTGVETTYFLAKIQRKILLVIIFNGEMASDDPTVISFIKGLYAKLRYSQLLQHVLTRGGHDVRAATGTPTLPDESASSSPTPSSQQNSSPSSS